MKCSRCGGGDPGCPVCREEEAGDRSDYDYESARDAELAAEEVE